MRTQHNHPEINRQLLMSYCDSLQDNRHNDTEKQVFLHILSSILRGYQGQMDDLSNMVLDNAILAIDQSEDLEERQLKNVVNSVKAFTFYTA